MGQNEGTRGLSQQALERIIANVGRYKGVTGAVICDEQGLPLQSNLPVQVAEELSAQIASLVGKIYHVSREIANDVPHSIRLEMKNTNLEIIPDVENGIIIIAQLEKGR